MAQAENILISVEYEHVLKMLTGTKTAELRRRPLLIKPGTHVWVYSKLPRGQVELVAIADKIIAASPRQLWDLYQARIAISSTEFKAYLSGVSAGCAILLRDIKPLQPALKLTTLRRASRNFHPPQFFKRLLDHGPELRSLWPSVPPYHQAGAAY
jgi:predicted transcriptional regulator